MEYSTIKLEAIAAIKQDILSSLNITQLEDSSNLIEQGLSSIMLMKLASKLRKFGIKIPFTDLMEHPTLREWTILINSAKVRKSSKEKTRKEIKEKEKGLSQKEFDLTDVQYAYWVGRNDDQPLGGVGCHAYLEIDGENVDPVQLNVAWNALQEYHPMLRAKFTENGKQVIMDVPYSKQIKIYDLKDMSEEEVNWRLTELRTELSHRKLKIEKGEVAGVRLALLPALKTKMFFDVDLLIADVLSLSILIRDLAEVYKGKNFDVFPEFTFQNYIEGKKEETNSEELETDREYWRAKMPNLPKEAPNLPLKRKPELITKTVFRRRRTVIEKSTWDDVKEIVAKYQMTPSMFLLSCYVLVLERWCNQERFFINMPLFNRDTEDENLQNMVADFTNLLLIDFARKDKETFLETMQRIQKIFFENVAHSSYSGVNVQRDIYKEIGNSGSVAPVVFACNLDYSLETQLSRELFGEISYMVSQTPQVWLDFQTYIKDDSLILCWDAVEELYPERLIDDMFQSLVDIIHTLTKNKDWNMVFDLLPAHQKKEREAELKKILPLQYPNKLLFSDFLKNVENNPNFIAIIDGITGKKITYQELYDKSLYLSTLLLKKGVEKGDYVAITLPRGYEQIEAIIAVLFSGAVYVPIGINQPMDRREKIYSQIGIKQVISDTKTLDKVNLISKNVTIINMDEKINVDRISEPKISLRGDSAYVIMTSGSTGFPKGVEISHQSAVNTIDDLNKKYNISQKDAVLMVSAIDFDLSVYDIFGLLSVGGTIVTLDEDAYNDPQLWINLIDRHNISIWNSVPILFDMLVTMAEGLKRRLALRIVMISGDWIGINLPSRFYSISENSIVVAMGGATEASIWSNYLNVPHNIPTNWISIPYGKALDNQVYRVMDNFGRICPNYVAGELWIGGVGVAKGYRGDEVISSQKFLKDIVPWYRTGDIGRTWSDGTIEFLGRKDNQVKIKGHRIELGEIEKALDKHMSALNSVVCVTENKQLAAYVVVKNKEESSSEFQCFLEKYLPRYMIPEKYYFDDKMTLLENGKPDKKKVQEILNKIQISKNFVPAKSTLEINIENIWKSVLDKKEISMTDNFFKLGGDSLKAVTIITKMQDILDVPANITIQTLFKSPTIQSFVLEIENLSKDFEVETI